MGKIPKPRKHAVRSYGHPYADPAQQRRREAVNLLGSSSPRAVEVATNLVCAGPTRSTSHARQEYALDLYFQSGSADSQVASVARSKLEAFRTLWRSRQETVIFVWNSHIWETDRNGDGTLLAVIPDVVEWLFSQLMQNGRLSQSGDLVVGTDPDGRLKAVGRPGFLHQGRDLPGGVRTDEARRHIIAWHTIVKTVQHAVNRAWTPGPGHTNPLLDRLDALVRENIGTMAGRYALTWTGNLGGTIPADRSVPLSPAALASISAQMRTTLDERAVKSAQKGTSLGQDGSGHAEQLARVLHYLNSNPGNLWAGEGGVNSTINSAHMLLQGLIRTVYDHLGKGNSAAVVEELRKKEKHYRDQRATKLDSYQRATEGLPQLLHELASTLEKAVDSEEIRALAMRRTYERLLMADLDFDVDLPRPRSAHIAPLLDMEPRGDLMGVASRFAEWTRIADSTRSDATPANLSAAEQKAFEDLVKDFLDLRHPIPAAAVPRR